MEAKQRKISNWIQPYKSSSFENQCGVDVQINQQKTRGAVM